MATNCPRECHVSQPGPEIKMASDNGTDVIRKEDSASVNPGIEGPNAMYVKLIASDGHEFIIKRDHALTSGTIKALLSGPGQSFHHPLC